MSCLLRFSLCLHPIVGLYIHKDFRLLQPKSFFSKSSSFAFIIFMWRLSLMMMMMMMSMSGKRGSLFHLEPKKNVHIFLLIRNFIPLPRDTQIYSCLVLLRFFPGPSIHNSMIIFIGDRDGCQKSNTQVVRPSSGFGRCAAGSLVTWLLVG